MTSASALPDSSQPRAAHYPIDPQFLERWSPRAFADRGALQAEQLASLLEAARWAPSSNNEQPWRFVVGLRGTPAWDRLFGLLVPFNQDWAKRAGALVAIVSRKSFSKDSTPNRNHSFDAGAAWMSLALQAVRMRLYCHAMAGLDYDRGVQELGLTHEFALETIVAIGERGDPSVLPPPLQGRESPNSRRELAESVFEGAMMQPWRLP